MTVHEVRHLSVSIDVDPERVVAVAGDPRRLPDWAAGLAGAPVDRVEGRWVVDSPMGRVTVAFVPGNGYGVLDHDVTLPSGETVRNPLRVTPNGTGADVVFTVHRREGMTPGQFDADAAAVARDLETLRTLLEDPARRPSGD